MRQSLGRQRPFDRRPFDHRPFDRKFHQLAGDGLARRPPSPERDYVPSAVWRARQLCRLVRLVPVASSQRHIRPADEVHVIPKALEQQRHPPQRHARRHGLPQLSAVPLELEHVDGALAQRTRGTGEDVHIEALDIHLWQGQSGGMGE